MDNIAVSITAIATALIGVAIVAVIVSKNAQTPQVIQSAGSAFSAVIGAAVAPVSSGGSSMQPFTGSIGNLFGNSTGGYMAL